GGVAAALAGPMCRASPNALLTSCRGSVSSQLRHSTLVSPAVQDGRSNNTNSSSSSNQGGRHEQSRTQDPEPSLRSKMVESAVTTLGSVLVLGGGFALAAYAYHKSYKHLQLRKMTNAFQPGDPVLELAANRSDTSDPDAEHWIPRPEQAKIDKIIHGEGKGHYFLIMGEKGSGKSSMILEAMRKTDGDGVSMFEAHADLEIFRIRLGKALDYEYHEDYIGGYFSERGPRDTTALLDIERAFNKLEKVALRYRKNKNKPLVLVINQTHLIRDNDDGKDLLELLQQRAEQWAASNLVTMIFNTDDYWVYERFKQLAARMEVISVADLPKTQAVAALRYYRAKYFKEDVPLGILEQVYDRVGGRLNFLNRVAKSSNMMATCERIKEIEKTWFLNQCWILGTEMDDDVMDQQKWASAAMVLAQALVDKEEDMEKTYDHVTGHMLPFFQMHKAQQVMTRSDFIRELDRLNLFTITSNAEVRASSVPMYLAFKEICSEEGFRQFLEDTLQRISDIESLGRTRELVAKDLVLGGKYEFKQGWRGNVSVQLKEDQSKDEK
ncbi:hypothetical protein PG993_009488, partial [Apiospora rasikravindrae]